MTQDLIIGIAWYRSEDGVALKSIFVGSDKLQDSYQEWLEGAEEVEQRLRWDGHVVKRVHIDPKTFPGWCTLKGLRPNASARTEYASEVVRLKLDDKSI